MSADFLLELLSEEIPARMQARARNDLGRMFAEALAAAGLSHDGITTYSTPRRLALIARGLPLATEAASEELKGPRTSAPPQALEGFLRKAGLAQDQLEDRDGTWFARIDKPGRATAEVLAEAVAAIVRDFPWPKSMRWGATSRSTSSLRWVRPLHSIVALLGEEIVPVAIDGVDCGATTLGHRFHHPGPITIGGAHDYAQKLRACHVIVDQEERETTIRDGAAEAARKAGFSLVEDEGLVVENAGLTSLPVPLLGSFDPAFLAVPEELIQLTARINQKYFVMRDEGGKLAPHFVCVANIAANDGGDAIVAGNERVVAARLADARFFWEQDLKVPLEEQAKKLSGVVFHEKLGTVADKVERVASLVRWLVETGIIAGADPDQAERAARLAKADLVTGMVGEFPELQGVIGGHLARAQGEPDVIADAIRDHYKPVGQGDDVPTAPVTVAVSLADKLDTVLGFFANKFYPTGSRDPYALRRATLGAMRLLLANHVRLDLDDFFSNNIGTFFAPIADPSRPEPDVLDIAELRRDPNVRMEHEPGRTIILRGDAVLMTFRGEFESLEDWDERTNSVWDGYEKLLEFLTERMRVSLVESGYRHDHVNAAMGAAHQFRPVGLENYEYDVFRLLARVNALQPFVETPEGTDLLAAYKRAANILKKEKWDAGAAGDANVLPDEATLTAALDNAQPHAVEAVSEEDFTGAMAALSNLRGPIDAFFDKVTVNDPDAQVRARRLNLLARFRDAVHTVADFSKIEG